MDKGKESLEAKLLGRGQAIIVEELSKIPSFRQRLQELAKQFQDMVEIEEIEYPLEVMILNQNLEDKPEVIDRIEKYIDELSKLADFYNLRCNWIINGLHQIVRNLINPDIKTPISNIYIRFGIDRLKLDTLVYADTRKEDIQRLVDEEWERIKFRHPELRIREREPDEFDKHVRWLCQRLFFGKTGRNIDAGLTPDEEITSDYIDSMVRKTAKLLYIKLPRGRLPENRMT